MDSVYILLMRRDEGETRRGYDSRRKMGDGGCGRGKVGGLGEIESGPGR